MAQINMNPIGEVMPLDRLCEEFSKWQRLLRNVINGDIDFENIRAKGIIAESIDVDKLSAISADLGEIQAGIIRGIQIFGSYIATREGAYPRAELNDSDDLFAVYKAADNFSKFADNLLGSPGLLMSDPVTLSAIYNQSVGFPALLIQSTQDIDLKPGTGRFVFVPDWSQVYSNGDSQSLQQALDNLTSAINTLNTNMATKGNSTGSGGGGNGGIPIGTQLATTSDGSTVDGSVTWVGISSHSHTQT